ncbi:MAG: hypothetical protein HYS05_21230 [Acidobacteria bacterium]|nr:hypothetical protein [Acidobacteriota bacterium]
MGVEAPALVATRERTRFTRELFGQLPDLRIIAQTGNHAYHIDLAAAEARGIVVCALASRTIAGAGAQKSTRKPSCPERGTYALPELATTCPNLAESSCPT